jgi:hypothetical protein
MSIAARLEKHSIPEPNSGCLLWTGRVDPAGYGRMGGRGVPELAHRAAWLAAHGSIPDGLHVCHKCDVRSCVEPTHLFLGTHQENMADRDLKGRQRALLGEEHGMAKLTEDGVRLIRRGGIPRREIAELLCVSVAAVDDVRQGRTWRHV